MLLPKLPEAAGGVRTIYPQRPGRNDGNIYVGTTRNNILEGSLQRRFTQVVFGHGRQLWGLAAHPEDELYATAGHDKHVALWRKNKLIWTIQTGYECVALAFHPFGTALAAGSTEGHLLVINCDNGAVMLTLRVCGSPLNCVSFNQGMLDDTIYSISLYLTAAVSFCSRRYDCHGLAKRKHLPFPCLA